jgi:COMPASS component SWD3
MLERVINVSDLLNPPDPRIKKELLRLVIQFLAEEGYVNAKMVLVDEANLRFKERDEKTLEFLRLRKAILDGDWNTVEQLSVKPLVKNHKSFLYQIYKTQYLEYIDHHETQKAFTHLIKRLKPLEHFQTTPNEFMDLCYLLTFKSIQEVPAFKTWEGIAAARERLIEQLENMMELDSFEHEDAPFIPPGNYTRAKRP